MTTIRWGILGTGKIAGALAGALPFVADSALVAVGSRTQESADAFGAEYNIPHRHGSYQALVDDPEVDVIYISTPHNLHYENCIQCLNAGKHVLCEKAFTLNRSQAEKIFALAKEKNLFVMEAMWTRFLPAIDEILKRIAAGEIGYVLQVNADFGFRGNLDPEHRLYNPNLAGGALLDVGVYVISMAYMVFPEVPKQIQSVVHMGETGVDYQVAMAFGYGDGRMSSLTCSTRLNTEREAVISGTEGLIRIHRPFWKAEEYSVIVGRERDEEITVSRLPHVGNGYNYEADEVVRCIQAGLLESPCVSWQHTLDIMGIMDTLRAQWGLVYPEEK